MPERSEFIVKIEGSNLSDNFLLNMIKLGYLQMLNIPTSKGVVKPNLDFSVEVIKVNKNA